MQGKKGTNYFYILGVIAFIVIGMPVFSITMDMLNTGLQNVDINSSRAKSTAGEITGGFSDTADLAAIMVIAALYIGALVLALFLRTEPYFIVGGIIMMVLFLWFGMYFADAFNDVSTEPGLFADELDNNFPMLSFFMQWFLEINIGFTGLVMLGLYFKG